MAKTIDPPASDLGAALPGRWGAAVVLFLASFMNIIDVSIVNVALPTIQSGLHASSTQLEWVAAIYVLAFATGLLPFGRFGDIWGRRRLFQVGLLGFTLCSLACGVAPSIGVLIAARAAQGLAGAMMMPQVLAIVHVIFPPEEKNKAFGLFGMVTSLGAVAGPVLGGSIISANLWGLDWRMIFLINVPLGIMALIGTVRLLPKLPHDQTMHADWVGVGLFAAAVTVLVLPLIEGRNIGWPWWAFVVMAAAVPMAVLFWRQQGHRAQRGLAQLVPAHLLANREFLSGLGLVTLFFSGIPGIFLILAVFFQSGFGMSALQSGLATAPFPLGVLIAAAVSARLRGHHFHLRVAVAAVLLVIGMALLQAMITSSDSTMSGVHFILPLAICGFSMGIAVAALFQSVLTSVAGADAGAGSGALQAFQQIGGVLGIAIVGQIFFATLGSDALLHGGGGAQQAAFIDAAATATWYPIAAFASIAVGLGWRALRKKKP